MQRSMQAASAFREALTGAVEGIKDDPHLGAPYGQRYRWMKLRRFPYVLYYEVLATKSRVEVSAVAHSHRRPG